MKYYILWSRVSAWQNLGEGCLLTSQPKSLWILFSPPEVPYYLGGELWQEWAVLLWWYGMCVNKANTKPWWRGRWYLDPLIAICTMAQWPAPEDCSIYQHKPRRYSGALLDLQFSLIQKCPDRVCWWVSVISFCLSSPGGKIDEVILYSVNSHKHY